MKQISIILTCCLVLCLNAVAQKGKRKQAPELDSAAMVMKGNLTLPFQSCSIKLHYGFQPIANVTMINPGITFLSKEKTNVSAAWEGTVSKVLSIDNFWIVIVQSGTVFHCYAGLESPKVKVNDKIVRGQCLGKLAFNDDGEYELDFLLSACNEQCDPEKWFSWKKECDPETPILYSY